MRAGNFFGRMEGMTFSITESILSTAKMSSKKNIARGLCRQCLPGSYRPTKAHPNKAPVSLHIRLAYSHDDDYNVTKNSERKEKHWDFDHWRIVSACPGATLLE